MTRQDWYDRSRFGCFDKTRISRDGECIGVVVEHDYRQGKELYDDTWHGVADLYLG